jgi:heparan-alpha-glucosaminide N-acetyltransferase
VSLTSKRLFSIDVFRAITMLFMIFVNDLSGVRDVPGWIDHVKASEDGMHFADTIFPVFLFIAGLSIPLGVGKRINRGESFPAIAGHILLRSLALIAMGFFHVNLENYSRDAVLPIGVWELLLTLSFFLIWLDYPESLSKVKRYMLTGTGIALLVMLAILFKGGSPDAPEGLRPSWWGILGIIGWAYLVCAFIFVIAKGRLSVLLGALIIFVAINISIHASLVDMKLWAIKDCSSVSLMMFGVVVSLLYFRLIEKGNYRTLWLVFTASGAGLILLGLVIRPYTEGISKIHSTPSWVFICTGIGILVFELLIWLVDVKGKQNWFGLIKPAGTSTLTCYLLPYFMVAIFYIVHFRYPRFLNYGAGGIIRSFAVAFILILVTGVLEKRRLRLKI